MRYASGSHWCAIALLLALGLSLGGCARQAPKEDADTTAAEPTGQAPTDTVTAPTAPSVKTGKPAAIDPEVRKPFSKAVAALRANDPQTAIDILTPLSQSHPDYAGIWVNMGIAYYQLKQPDSARSAFNKAIELDASQAAAHNYLGFMARAAGQFQQAEAAYGQALQANPDYALAHLNIGVLYDLYLHQSERALAHYREYQILSGSADKAVSKWIIDLERRVKAGK